MAPSNRPSKAERQRRNRARREARAARSAHAGEATELYDDETTDTDTDATDGPDRDERDERPARRSRMAAAAERRNSRYQYPGQRAVVLAFLFSIASVGLLVFSPVPVEREVPADEVPAEFEDEAEVDEEDGTATYPEDVKLLEEEALAVALAVMLTPVAITGSAAYFAKHERRSTIWTGAMLALAAYVFFLGGAYSIYTLPALVAVGVGGFQARRDENKERVAELKAQRAARKEAKQRGEVIDADVVEDSSDEDD